jgi:hypothetical protein
MTVRDSIYGFIPLAESQRADLRETSLQLDESEAEALKTLLETGVLRNSDYDYWAIKRGLSRVTPMPISMIERTSKKLVRMVESGMLNKNLTATSGAPANQLTEMASPELQSGMETKGHGLDGQTASAPKGHADKGVKQNADGHGDSSETADKGYMDETQMERVERIIRQRLEAHNAGPEDRLGHTPGSTTEAEDCKCGDKPCKCKKMSENDDEDDDEKDDEKCEAFDPDQFKKGKDKDDEDDEGDKPKKDESAQSGQLPNPRGDHAGGARQRRVQEDDKKLSNETPDAKGQPDYDKVAKAPNDSAFDKGPGPVLDEMEHGETETPGEGSRGKVLTSPKEPGTYANGKGQNESLSPQEESCVNFLSSCGYEVGSSQWKDGFHKYMNHMAST